VELILWRHADAEEGSPDGARRLTKKGERQAASMARWLKPMLQGEVSVLVSPAIRAQQTAQALNMDFVTVDALGVGASAQGILHAVHWPHKPTTVIAVGHQPTLGQVAALLLSGKVSDWSVKKGAIWWFERRNRGTRAETILRAMVTPEMLENS
jgi:phosphohistidine phosphatase